LACGVSGMCHPGQALFTKTMPWPIKGPQAGKEA